MTRPPAPATERWLRGRAVALRGRVGMREQQYGKYLLLDRIAVGGMAEIFLARQMGVEGFEKTVVLKRIRPHLGDKKSFVRMFLNEAKPVWLDFQLILQLQEDRQGDRVIVARERLDAVHRHWQVAAYLRSNHRIAPRHHATIIFLPSFVPAGGRRFLLDYLPGDIAHALPVHQPGRAVLRVMALLGVDPDRPQSGPREQPKP